MGECDRWELSASDLNWVIEIFTPVGTVVCCKLSVCQDTASHLQNDGAAFLSFIFKSNRSVVLIFLLCNFFHIICQLYVRTDGRDDYH